MAGGDATRDVSNVCAGGASESSPTVKISRAVMNAAHSDKRSAALRRVWVSMSRTTEVTSAALFAEIAASRRVWWSSPMAATVFAGCVFDE